MVSRRTLPCQYGSRDELAMMLARQSKPIETSLPEAVVQPLWQARQRSEVWNLGAGSDGRRSERVPDQRQQQQDGQPRISHHQPSVRRPSPQSHSR